MKQKLLLTLALTALTSLPTFAGSGSTTFYGRLTANTNSSAQGLVYASTSNSSPSDSDYTNSVTTSTTNDSSTDDNVSLTYYAYAKAARGYAFSSWTAGTNTSASTSTGSGDAITVTASSESESSPTTGTVTAVWTALDSYTISYQAPEAGTYTVDYSYLSVSNNKFVDGSTSYSLSSSSSTQAVTSYAADVVTLSTTNDTFQGWYEVDDDGNETLLSEASTYTYSVTKDATIKAKFPSSCTLSFQAPELGTYSVTYPTHSTGDATISLTSISEAQEVAVYSGDVVTLTATSDNFLGWYVDDSETALSTETTYTYTVTGDATITAKFSASTANAASVTSNGTTTEYGTLAEAINAANKLSTNPTVTLLRDVYDLTAQQTISKSMTIDLNGHMVVATSESTSYNKIFYINGSGIEVTITDSSTDGGGQLLFSGSLNTSMYGIHLNNGTLNITGGKIYVKNGAEYASNTSSKAYGVLVAAGKTLDVSGSEIEADASRYAYGISANGSASATTTVKVTNSTITANAEYYAYGITGYADVTLSNATINASATVGSYAYGVNVSAGASYEGSLSMTGGSINASAALNYAYGIQNAASATLSGAAITASGVGGQNTFGISASRSIAGTNNVSVSNTKIEASGKRTVYGISATSSATGTTNVDITNGSSITASADSTSGNVYGVTGSAKFTLSDGNSVSATATKGSAAYGINLTASSSGFYGTLNMTGGTINVSTATTYAYGINIGRAMTYDGQEVTATYRGEATISGGTINATAATSYAYGVNTYGPTEISGGTISATANTSQYAYGVRTVDDTTTITSGTISATASYNAYGVYAAAETTSDRGVKAEGNVVISGGDISATTTSTTGANGVYVQATSRTITNTASGYYPGYYAAAGAATISGGNITATTATTTAYGVYVGRSMQYNGQDIAAIDRGELTITGGTISATAGSTTAYGVYTYGPTEISGGTITAKATSTTAYGVRVYDDTTTISGENTTISATATQNAYGVAAAADITKDKGVKAEGNVEILGGNISATTTSATNAFGVYVQAASLTITSTASGYYPGYYAAAGAATISGGTISATAATTTAYSVFAAATSTNGTASATPTCEITGGKFAASATSTYANINSTASTDSVTISGGYYTQNTNLSRYLANDLFIYELESTTDEYTEGYRYYVSAFQESEFVAQIGTTSSATKYATLEAALSAASSGNTVVLINNYKLSSETTVPSGVTLLIPYDSNYTLEDDEPETTETFSIGSAYKTLIMLSGSSISVADGGAICVGGVQFGASNSDSGSNGGAGSVSGDYGCIDMSAGGTITLEDGANLYAWGYIVGQSMSEGDNTTAGTIVATSGSNVYEIFYIGDWHGGGNTYALYSDRSTYKVFPFNQYSIPNIEVPLTIEYGAIENVHLFIPTSSMDVSQTCPFIGSSDDSFFKMSDGCSVTKRYDPTTDRLHLDIEGDLSVNKMSISASLFTFSSSSFVMPITNNLYVRANSGTLTVPYEMSILPHAVVEIGEGATAEIKSNVYVYDLDEWDKYVYSPTYYYRTYNYRPTSHLTRSTTDWASKDALEDGKLIVDGTMNVSGNLYTTSSGADICSNNAGTINFTAAPTASSNIYQVLGYGSTETDYEASVSIPLGNSYTQYCTKIPVVASLLHNVDDSYTYTAGSSANTTFNYVDGYWISAAESLTAYTVDDNSGTSKSLTEWSELQETYPNAIALYTGSDENVQKLTNVVVNDSESDGYVCTNFVATDKQPIDIPFEFTATTASYSRAATNYSSDLNLQFGTICLPYAVESSDDIQFYSFTSLDGDAMIFTEVKELAANTPALFSVATDADRTTVDIIAENATIPVTEEGTVTEGGLTLHGVLTAAQTLYADSESTDYYIAQNKFWRPTTNNVTVNPFRAYFTTDSSTAGVNMFSIAIGDGDEATSVSSVNTDDDEIEGIYSVSGMRQSTVQKGINIIRFKSGRTQKVMIK